jgi:hypothetical protein
MRSGYQPDQMFYLGPIFHISDRVLSKSRPTQTTLCYKGMGEQIPTHATRFTSRCIGSHDLVSTSVNFGL